MLPKKEFSNSSLFKEQQSSEYFQLILIDQGDHSDLISFNMESFKTFRVPQLLKQKTGRELFLGITVHTPYSSLKKVIESKPNM